jgi:hypothetical protein
MAGNDVSDDVFSIAITSPSIQAQHDELSRKSLKGIDAVEVLVEDLPDGAKVLGLTRESIQTDVELKLRLAGMRVVSQQEDLKLPGMPDVHVMVAVTQDGTASFISVELRQNAMLARSGEIAFNVTTWDSMWIGSNMTAQSIREKIKDKVDEFLNAWLSVNPKK